jgi:hypothetical protein
MRTLQFRVHVSDAHRNAHARARALSLSLSLTHTLLRGFIASARRRTPLVLFFICPKKEIASEVRGKCEASNTSFSSPPLPPAKKSSEIHRF